MRRKYLLSVAMLSVLLAASACTAGTPAQVSSPQPAGSADATFAHGSAGGNSRFGTGSSKGPEIGISQWNAAEAAKTAKAKAVSAAKAKAVAEAKATVARSAAAKATAEEASKAAAAEKAEAAKAAKDAAAKKGTAPVPAKTPPTNDHGMKRVTPVPVTPKQTPAPVEPPSPEESPSPEETEGQSLDLPPGARIHLPDVLPDVTVEGLLP